MRSTSHARLIAFVWWNLCRTYKPREKGVFTMLAQSMKTSISNIRRASVRYFGSTCMTCWIFQAANPPATATTAARINSGGSIEDTILVTPNGAEILTTGLPKEVNELLALIRTRTN